MMVQSGNSVTTAQGASVDSILVVGAGAMGSQIGMVCALAGIATTVQDVSADSLARAREQLGERLARAVVKGSRTADDVAAAFRRLTFSPDLAVSAESADFVIEAATERLEVKKSIFRQLGELTPERAILATNSSTLGSSSVAEASGRPDRVCNLHFFNPALVMKAVEIVRNPHTSDVTVRSAVHLATRLGKEAVMLHREIPGFVANRLMGAVRDEALRLHADGIASIEDIDTAARSALGHPMGPFELMDLVGLDVSYLIRMATFGQTQDPADLPHPALVDLYERGDYGRKTGKGWFSYELS